MDNVMEYVFFDAGLAERFTEQCNLLGVAAELKSDQTPLGEASFSVSMSDLIQDHLMEAVESLYEDMLFGEQAALIEGNDERGAVADSCGMQIKLQSGAYTNIEIQPEIMNKLLSVLDSKELQSFIEQVAEDIENPKTESICERHRVGTI